MTRNLPTSLRECISDSRRRYSRSPDVVSAWRIIAFVAGGMLPPSVSAIAGREFRVRDSYSPEYWEVPTCADGLRSA